MTATRNPKPVIFDRDLPPVLRPAQSAVTFARDRNLERDAVVDERALMRDALKRSMGQATFTEVRQHFDERIARGDFLEVKSNGPARAFTTGEMIGLERENIERMQAGQAKYGPLSSQQIHFEHLHDGQRQAVETILASRDQITGLQGTAGAGKTTSLAAIREAAEKEGYQVEGFAPTSRAAYQLEEAGIPATTLQHHLAKGEPARNAGWHLYFVDESSLASTKQMHEFFERLQENDRVVLVGDVRQHQAVDAGRPYEQLQQAGMLTARLEEIVRQKDPALKETVEQLAHGHVREAIGSLERQGRVHEIVDAGERMRAIASEYAAEPAGTLVISPDNQSRMELNRLIHAELQERGQVEERELGGTTLTTRYSYDPASRIASITYPDAALMTNQYDGAGYLQRVRVRPPGASAASPVANLTHLPFGPVSGASYGNRIAEGWTFDLDYRATALADTLPHKTVQSLAYAYDAANNVSTVTDAVNAANSQTFGYDVLNRLTSAASGTGGYGSYAWTYDKLGNRLTQTVGSTTTTYTYTPGNRLATITVGGVKTSVVTNANGSITSIPPANSSTAATFAYNNANRLASVTGTALAATFVYDAFGRRFSKTNPGSPSILYTYAQNGSLLEENNNGAITDYLYADRRPISVLQPGVSPTANQVNYVLADRPGTPQLGSGTSVCPSTYYVLGGCGTVFELTPPAAPGDAWTETILHDFTGQNGDGAMPLASLALSSTGVLYGTTSAGGTAGKGTVFAVAP